MKKVLLSLIAVIFLSFSGYSQAEKYLNFGGLGTGLYAGIEFPVADAITVGPHVSTNYEFENLIFAGKGNYYFDELFGLPGEWDVYAGANIGFRVDNDNNGNGNGGDGDGLHLGAQIGGRWFWNDKWGINAEFGGGTAVLGGVGVTLKL